MPRKRLSDFSGYDVTQLLEVVQNQGFDKPKNSLIVVLKRIMDIPEYSCTINMKAEEGVIDFVKKWELKYLTGYNNRPSKRTSNPISTQHDDILDEIISARIANKTDDLDAIKYGHRLAMSAENITGSLLEEYVAINLLNFGWHCCWGETMKSVDFCCTDGRLLQIKNSDNSENSSSKAIREGTEILHWFRRFSRTGETNWPALNNLVGIATVSKHLTEISFRKFVRDTVTNNPGAVFLESESPWQTNLQGNKES
jgi:hypothetical protein